MLHSIDKIKYFKTGHFLSEALVYLIVGGMPDAVKTYIETE